MGSLRAFWLNVNVCKIFFFKEIFVAAKSHYGFENCFQFASRSVENVLVLSARIWRARLLLAGCSEAHFTAL